DQALFCFLCFTFCQTLKKNLEHGQELEKELVNHMSSLPDLNLLPDMTAGLDPLPTVGDLFG
ncbi:hypothetical protein FBUS_09393, partial [Fasciolopsis buskii]